SGEIVALRGGAGGPPDPWSYHFITSSGRLLFYGGLGLAGLSLPLLGFLLVRILAGSPAPGSTMLALVVGSLTAISFPLISLSMTVLNVLLVDLARNIRWLRDHAERETGIVRG